MFLKCGWKPESRENTYTRKIDIEGPLLGFEPRYFWDINGLKNEDPYWNSILAPHEFGQIRHPFWALVPEQSHCEQFTWGQHGPPIEISHRAPFLSPYISQISPTYNCWLGKQTLLELTFKQLCNYVAQTWSCDRFLPVLMSPHFVCSLL